MSDALRRDREIEFIARGLAVRGGDVLLCRNVKKGYFYLPGGHIDPMEAAADACAREYLEETGLQVRPGACLLVAEVRFGDGRKAVHELNVVFHVEHENGSWPEDVASREEKISFEWVDRAALVDIDLRPRAIRAWLVADEQGDELGGDASLNPDHTPLLWLSDRESDREQA